MLPTKCEASAGLYQVDSTKQEVRLLEDREEGGVMIFLGLGKLTRGYKAGALPSHMVLVALSAVLGGSKSLGPL